MPPSNTLAIVLRALANTGSPRFPSLPSTHDNKKGWPFMWSQPSIKPHYASKPGEHITCSRPAFYHR
jgi:hypothetical protein